MHNQIKDFAVYGGGSFGTALACVVANIQEQVFLFLRNADIIAEILNKKTNSKYLNDILLPYNINPTNKLEDIINCDAIIIAVPSNSFLDVILTLKENGLSSKTILIIATKGLVSDYSDDTKQENVRLLSEKIPKIISNPFAFLAGPNFAHEIANKMLTASTIACTDIEIANKIAKNLESKNFIVNTTNDIITVQIASVIKNVIAIQSGIYQAMGYGDNAKSFLITQGIKEIRDLATKIGGQFDTLLEPAVLGDLILTAYSQSSRNTKFGFELYYQNNIPLFIKNYPKLVEGIKGAHLINKLAIKHNVYLPIVNKVDQLLTNQLM